MSLLIRGAWLDGRSVDVAIEGDTIARVAPGAGGRRDEGGVGAGPAVGQAGGPSYERVIDAGGLHVFPGLANGHTHAAMTLFRGYGDDLPLMEWLQTRIWPAEALLTEDDVYHGTRLAILEMIRSGTTYFNDMYWHREGVRRAVDELGLRAHLGSVFIDRGDAAAARAQREAVIREVAERESLGPRLRLALAPHAIYTVGNESLEWLGGLAREHELLLHIHLSETDGEVRECVAKHGVRPAYLLDRLGLAGPNLVAAHGVYLDGDELALLGARGATVSQNPGPKLTLARGGIFYSAAARAAGLRVVLGTDGPGSNNSLDLIEEMKVAALVQKHRAVDATVLPAPEALGLATTAAGEAFGLGTGRVEAGAPADLILVDLSHPSTRPGHDPVSDLVYAANGRAVHTTICAGRVLMHDRVVEVGDEDGIIRDAVGAARGLLERAGGS